LSHFGWIDGGIVGLYLLATMAAGLAVRRYVGKVEDFLLAGREMDVHLGIASLAATEFGIVTCMYAAEGGYRYGFSGSVPGILMALAMFLVGWTGFCVKPLREASVMTLPGALRAAASGPACGGPSGVVIVLGGLLNMGVFLRMGGEFLMTVTGIGAATSRDGFLGRSSPPRADDDRAPADGGRLHDPRRHALGPGHRLPPVRRDEHRPRGRDLPAPGKGRLRGACRHRGGPARPRRLQSARASRDGAGPTCCSTPSSTWASC
jgi:hypothetical protein